MALKKRLRDRPTSEIVVLLLTFTACAIVVLDLLVLVFLSVFKPDVPLAEFARNVGDVVNVLIGAVVGYLAGSFSVSKDKEETDDDEGTSGR